MCGLLFVDLFPLFFEISIAVAEDSNIAVLEPDGALGHRLQERAIMADEDEGRSRFPKVLFKPLNRLNIQMVCRLIENHEIGFLRKQSGQRRFSALAAGCGRCGRFEI